MSLWFVGCYRSAESFEEAFRPQMRIALEHLHALVSRDARNFHGMQALLKQSGRCLVT